MLLAFWLNSDRSLQNAGLWIAVWLGVLLGMPSPASAQCVGNPIVCENQHPGTANWQIDGVPIETWAGSATSQDLIGFGQGSTSLSGTTYYRSFRFEISAVAVPGMTSIGMLLLALGVILSTARLVTRRSERAA